jgi:glucose-6-phosphate 1-dehydrogenase
VTSADLRSAPSPPPLILTVFGASGDLAERKLFPALRALSAADALPDPLVVVGVARRDLSDEAFQQRCLAAGDGDGDDRWRAQVKRFRYLAGDYNEPATFARLAQLYAEIDRESGTLGNRVYYLATVPALFATVANGLASVEANVPGEGGSFARLVVEKPFGTDRSSARALDRDLHESFAEDQIFRIDHYMGKETVLNVLALRFANAIFEPIWNRRYVDHIQLTVAEDLGIEHRGAFYEHAGALRDIVQNHVMQVLALTLMEPPGELEADAIRDEKVKLLRAVVIGDTATVTDRVVRAQYRAGHLGAEAVVGYREEEGVDPASDVETYLAMQLQVDNWRWAGVPIFIRTGKRLAQRATEVTMVFQRPPHLPFAGALARELRPDALTLRIQPDEGVALCFGAKVPGPSFTLRSVAMDFSYKNAFSERSGDAYERLLHDVMIGDPLLFIRADEVDRAWAIVAPIQQAFAADDVPLAHYDAGSWGPSEADGLLESTGHSWLNP